MAKRAKNWQNIANTAKTSPISLIKLKPPKITLRGKKQFSEGTLFFSTFKIEVNNVPSENNFFASKCGYWML